MCLSVIHRGDSSLKNAAVKAYNDVLKPHHGLNIQQACATGLDSLPTRALILLVIGETGESLIIANKKQLLLLS